MAKFKYRPVPVSETGRAPPVPAPSHEVLPKVIGAGFAAILAVILLTMSVSSPQAEPAMMAAGSGSMAEPTGADVAGYATPMYHSAADDDDRGAPISVTSSPNMRGSNPAADDDDRAAAVATAAAAFTPVTTTTTTTSGSTGTTVEDPSAFCAAERQKALARTNENILECKPGEDCRLNRDVRYQAVDQKGVTLWMTGLSGSGKTTIARALEDELLKKHGKHVYRLDGDNLRGGLNADLGLSSADRDENVRRAAEVAALFADAGVITIASLISPFREGRDHARRIHEAKGIPFMEVYMDVSVEEAAARDPKGLYAKALRGEIKGFTGIDSPYEPPLNPEVSLPNAKISIEQCVARLMNALRGAGVLTGGTAPAGGLLPPDGGEPINLIVPDDQLEAKKAEAETLPTVLLSDVDVNWLQVIGEGWAAPLRGFMREGVLLQTLHFNSLLVDPYDLVGKAHVNEQATSMIEYGVQPHERVSMPIPIVLPITSYTKSGIEGASAVALVNKYGERLAILRDPEVYANRKQEIINRAWGALDPEHPYQKMLLRSGNWLLGGEVELLGRIRYNDGMDKFRLTADELTAEFARKGADVVYAFQTRNPTHAGHAYLMKTGRTRLMEQGYTNPVLWLSPLGGYTKPDDVPLDVRVSQHEAIIKAGMLDEKTTVMAIWPAPMIYAGPTEVQFHAKSRRCAGASYFVAGRDPAGMKWQSGPNKDDDLYDANHGRYVLQTSPGLGDMEILSFQMVYYDKADHSMKEKDPSRPDSDYLKISGSTMRALGRMGAEPCVNDQYDSPLTCVPEGFMAPEGWAHVTNFYMNEHNTEKEWVHWSIQVGHQPRISHHAQATGTFGKKDFAVYVSDAAGKHISPWHDLALDAGEGLYNMVVEISAGTTAKMEVQKEIKGNPIMQDTNDDGSVRYYTFGAPEFNYGMMPQTWEDPEGAGDYPGDNDPLDVIEVGSHSLAMGKVVAVRVLGSLELIDEGEVDHKIIVLSDRDEAFARVHNFDDLERERPGTTARLVDWLLNYKTTDGKPVNVLSQQEPTTAAQAEAIIAETHGYWQKLVSGERHGAGFWLANDDDAQ